jgi:hypothetical protein
MGKRTSAAKAGFGGVICGTAEAVPFQDYRAVTQTLEPDVLSNVDEAMKNFLDSMVAHPVGAFILLTLAAFLEAFGDSLFQSGLYRSAGAARGLFFLAGGVILALYGFTVNIPHWDFGKLLGVYVVLFFLVAQVLAKIRFHQTPTPPIYVGGTLIATGGIIIAFWRG